MFVSRTGLANAQYPASGVPGSDALCSWQNRPSALDIPPLDSQGRTTKTCKNMGPLFAGGRGCVPCSMALNEKETNRRTTHSGSFGIYPNGAPKKSSSNRSLITQLEANRCRALDSWLAPVMSCSHPTKEVSCVVCTNTGDESNQVEEVQLADPGSA